VADHKQELMQLIEGSPNPPLMLGGMAEAIGISYDEAEGLLDELVREGRVRMDGERPIAVEPSGGSGEGSG
jgi:DNA-binding IclR family transcriptional regulator